MEQLQKKERGLDDETHTFSSHEHNQPYLQLKLGAQKKREVHPTSLFAFSFFNAVLAACNSHFAHEQKIRVV